MIRSAFVTEWRAKALWALDEQVEQDLILSRALVELYSEEVLQREAAFRGGTALYRSFLPSPARYSEDIGLVQVEAGPIGRVMDAVHRRLDLWLGDAAFQRDIEALLATGTAWGQSAAAEYALTKVAPLLSGGARKGPGEDAQR